MVVLRLSISNYASKKKLETQSVVTGYENGIYVS